jgi:hypothetical protein
MRRFVAIGILLLGGPRMAAGQDRLADPFSKEEWITVYRLSMSEAEALKFYDEQQGFLAMMRASVATDTGQGSPRPSPADSIGIEPAFGVSYSLDDLVMLSLLSEQTFKKVERVMASMGTWLGIEDDGARLFFRRRDELASWVAQRLREIRSQ